MKITHISVHPLRIPLKTPFVTALRTVTMLDNVCVAVHTEDGVTGFGEAASAAAVTGETNASVTEAVVKHLGPAVIGLEVQDFSLIADRIQTAIHANYTAKSAVECAVYDLYAKLLHVPLYRLLGGSRQLPENDITISVSAEANPALAMAADSLRAINEGYHILKIKLGKIPQTDKDTLLKLWHALHERYPEHLLHFRIDANQGWTAKEAVRLIRAWEDGGVPVEFVEQPVPAWDIDGMRTVTAHTDTSIMADESVFTLQDARRVLESRAADRVNIKLAKAGGIRRAMQIATLCEAFGVTCMAGCMLESRLGVSAAAHMVSAHKNFTQIDLDGPLLCAGDPFAGGPVFEKQRITFTEEEGIGLRPEVSV